MKLIIEAETEEDEKNLKGKSIVHENVKELLVSGVCLKDGVTAATIGWWTGTPEFLIGRTYYLLKDIESKLQKEEDTHGEKI